MPNKKKRWLTYIIPLFFLTSTVNANTIIRKNEFSDTVNIISHSPINFDPIEGDYKHGIKLNLEYVNNSVYAVFSLQNIVSIKNIKIKIRDLTLEDPDINPDNIFYNVEGDENDYTSYKMKIGSKDILDDLLDATDVMVRISTANGIYGGKIQSENRKIEEFRDAVRSNT